MAESSEFQRISWSLNANIETLRVFSEQIGTTADEHDMGFVPDLCRMVSEIFDDESLKEEEKSLLESYILENDAEIEQIPTEQFEQLQQKLKTLNAPEVRVKVDEWLNRHPEKAGQIYLLFSTMLKKLPIQGRLLRRGALIMLVSVFEMLVTDLIRTYYHSFPNALQSDDQKITLSDLRALGDLKEAEEHLINMEADRNVRKSLKELLAYLSRALDLDLQPLREHVPHLQEIIQRRNLFVHNDGVVNRVYLSQVDKEYLELRQFKAGQRLAIPPKYLSESIDVVYLIGVILLQQGWRKWANADQQGADKAILDSTYSLLEAERYQVVTKLCQFAANLKFASNGNRYTAIVNHAIALRELGERSKMNQLLRRTDWAATPSQFKIAAYVLREEYEKAYDLLPQAIAKREIPLIAKDWPLFKPMRRDERFTRIFEGGCAPQPG
jgi:hypothetical protein